MLSPDTSPSQHIHRITNPEAPLAFLFQSFYQSFKKFHYIGMIILKSLAFGPWGRKWQPTPVFLPGKAHGKSLAGYSPWGRRESDTVRGVTKSQTEQLTLSLSLSFMTDEHLFKYLLAINLLFFKVLAHCFAHFPYFLPFF